MPDLKTDWSYPVMETTLDKRVERPGVQRGYSSEMTGVDGRSEGGLKPFPGFKLVHTMTGLYADPNHSRASRIIDFKAIDFRIGSDHYGYGFVYRVTRGSTSVCDVFIDYWDSVSSNWTYSTKLMSGMDSGGQFDVEVYGRFVYTFIEGVSPALFYVEAVREKDYYPEADTFITSASPTTPNGGSLSLTVAGTSPSTHTKNALMRFNTSDGANNTVESATLSITVSGNAVGAASTIFINPVTDPSATGVLWTSANCTWNNRDTATAWSTAGGSFSGATGATVSVEKGFLGRINVDVKALVQACINSSTQSFTSKTDFLIRGHTAGLDLTLASVEQVNLLIRPKLSVRYSSKTFVAPVIVSETVSPFSIPGPGLQPTLVSPERGTVAGSVVPPSGNRPATAQIVLASTDPYADTSTFPNQGSGLCAGDTFPAAGAITYPGGAQSYSPTGAACNPSSEGLQIQLLSPANGQTGVSVTPTLDWTAYYPDGTALPANVLYDVFLIEEGKGDLENHCLNGATPLTSSSYAPAQHFSNLRLEYGRKYLWTVAVKQLTCTGYNVTAKHGTFTTENRYPARKFEPGDYSFGYVLVNSKTGRRSAFSEIGQVKSEDFLLRRTSSGQSITVKKDAYMGIEIVYDSSKYDLLYAYRSVKIQDAGGTMVSGIPFLDAVVTLQDYQTCKNGTGRTYDPANTSNRHAMYFYELEDKQLVYQAPYTDRSVFDEKMPHGGAACFYQNTMMVSKVMSPVPSVSEERRNLDVSRGLGEMRWSSLMDISPELFPPFNRYNPTVPSNEVIAFSKVGSYVLGLSRDKVYHVRKNGAFIKITEMHEGYGVVNPKAVDSVGNAAYYVTSHGLKSVDAQGQLDEVRNLNSVIVNEWRNDLTSIQVAHDPYMNCLFVHNTVQEESYVLWFGSGKTTKLKDVNFSHVSQGAWPIDWVDATDDENDLTRRCFFLLDCQETRASGTGLTSFTGPRVYVVDSAASRTISGGSTSWNGARRITTLDFSGDSRFVASGNWSGTDVPISVATGTVVPSNAWQYCYLYLVAGKTTQHFGKKAKIMHNTATEAFVDHVAYPWIADVVEGDVFVVSPVVFEWAGHPLGLSTEQGLVFSNADFFRMKVVSSIGASFADVSGPPTADAVTASTPLDRFKGLLFDGTEQDASMTADTRDTAGALYSSVEDDEGLVYAAFGSDSSEGRYGAKGNSLTPGIRILCPDLDFRLLGCLVRGTITNVERTSNIRGS